MFGRRKRMDKDIEQLRGWMEESKKTVAVTGSGISYLYGVGRLKRLTNRSDMMRSLTPGYVREHPEEYYAVMKEAFLDATFGMGPSKVHRQMVELEKRGMLHGIITQNMDYLHELAGSTNVVGFQGDFSDNVCVGCGERVKDVNVWNVGKAPRCPKCGAPLMPSNFDREAPFHDAEYSARMKKAQDMLSDADLVLIIGTSGFMSEQYMAKLNKNAKLVQINPGRTAFDPMMDINIREDADKVFDKILNG